MASAFDPVSGRYTDWNGLRWYCANRGERMVCHSDDGHMTAADFSTFRKWAWRLAYDPAAFHEEKR